MEIVRQQINSATSPAATDRLNQQSSSERRPPAEAPVGDQLNNQPSPAQILTQPVDPTPRQAADQTRALLADGKYAVATKDIAEVPAEDPQLGWAASDQKEIFEVLEVRQNALWLRSLTTGKTGLHKPDTFYLCTGCLYVGVRSYSRAEHSNRQRIVVGCFYDVKLSRETVNGRPELVWRIRAILNDPNSWTKSRHTIPFDKRSYLAPVRPGWPDLLPEQAGGLIVQSIEHRDVPDADDVSSEKERRRIARRAPARRQPRR